MSEWPKRLTKTVHYWDCGCRCGRQHLSRQTAQRCIDSGVLTSPKRWDEIKLQQILNLTEDGKTAKEIAALYGCTHHNIRRLQEKARRFRRKSFVKESRLVPVLKSILR